MTFRSGSTARSGRATSLLGSALVRQTTLPERHGYDELRVIGVSELLIPTDKIVRDLVRSIGTEVEASREMPRGGTIQGFLGDIRHTAPFCKTGFAAERASVQGQPLRSDDAALRSRE